LRLWPPLVPWFMLMTTGWRFWAAVRAEAGLLTTLSFFFCPSSRLFWACTAKPEMRKNDASKRIVRFMGSPEMKINQPLEVLTFLGGFQSFLMAKNHPITMKNHLWKGLQ
jgi:hypothetical protein